MKVVEWVGGPKDGQTFKCLASVVRFATVENGHITQWEVPIRRNPDGYWRCYWAERQPL
jgi:hypothetical protein